MDFIIQKSIKEYINSKDLKVSKIFIGELDEIVKLILDIAVTKSVENNVKTVLRSVLPNSIEEVWGLTDEIWFEIATLEGLLNEMELFSDRLNDIFLKETTKQINVENRDKVYKLLEESKKYCDALENLLMEIYGNRWKFDYDIENLKKLREGYTKFLEDNFEFVNKLYDKYM